MNVAVIGLGIEGKDVINYLLHDNNKVTLFDQKLESELDFEGVDKSKIKLVCGPNYLDSGFGDYDLVVRSPGIRPDVLKGAKEITSAMQIFFDNTNATIIGVTGTKGKGTTSTLIYEILKQDGKDVHLVGNIGKPYLELLPRLTKNSFVVMEMSSFQLFDLTKSPSIAVVLNITLDHMDWHTSREEYVKAKENIVKFQNKEDYAVINEDYETPKSFAGKTKAKVVFFSKGSLPKQYKTDILLKGEHNFENIAAALEVGKILNVDEDKILDVVRNFKGLEHRLELVKTIDGIAFYNDSFSTNPQTTIAAIKAFKEPITLILGGSDKGLDYDEMGKEIGKAKNIQNIILIGQIADLIKRSIEEYGYNGKIINLGMDTTMQEIVKKASEITEKKGVVLLSPATASFGMFENYKDRGNQFKENVKKL